MRYKRMLESAAAAVGYEKLPVEGWTIDTLKGMRLVNKDNIFQRYWNPLLNAEDCESLANALGIKVYTLDNGDICASLIATTVIKTPGANIGKAAREAVTEVAAKYWRVANAS